MVARGPLASISTPLFIRRAVALLSVAALGLVGAGCAGSPEGDQPVVDDNQSVEAPQSEPQSNQVEEEDLEDPATQDSTEEDTTEVSAGTDTSKESDLVEGWTTGIVNVERSGPSAVPPIITGLRLGQHDGYDRVVVDLKGEGPVGYRTAWVDTPREQARGQVLDVGGTAFLSVNVTGTTIPMTDEDLEDYYDVTQSQSTGAIEAIYDSSFEGNTHVVIGMSGQHPYRIFVLEDPLRVVIDVQN